MPCHCCRSRGRGFLSDVLDVLETLEPPPFNPSSCCPDAFFRTVGRLYDYSLSRIPPYPPPPQSKPQVVSEPGMKQGAHPAAYRRPSRYPGSRQAFEQKKFLCCVHRNPASEALYYTKEVVTRCCACATCFSILMATAGCALI